MNIGDKVYYAPFGYGIIKGMIDKTMAAVEFDNTALNGHTCEGLVPSGNGWYVKVSALKLETAYTKQDLIIKKIKYLQKKFDERKSNHACPF